MRDIENLLDESIEVEGYKIFEREEIDISKIDFEALRKRFVKEKPKGDEENQGDRYFYDSPRSHQFVKSSVFRRRANCRSHTDTSRAKR